MILLFLEILAYLTVGFFVISHINNEIQIDSYSEEWQDGPATFVGKVILWPFIAGFYYGFKWLLDDWFGL